MHACCWSTQQQGRQQEQLNTPASTAEGRRSTDKSMTTSQCRPHCRELAGSTHGPLVPQHVNTPTLPQQPLKCSLRWFALQEQRSEDNSLSPTGQCKHQQRQPPTAFVPPRDRGCAMHQKGPYGRASGQQQQRCPCVLRTDWLFLQAQTASQQAAKLRAQSKPAQGQQHTRQVSALAKWNATSHAFSECLWTHCMHPLPLPFCTL